MFFSTNEIVRPHIKLSSCLESFVQSEIIEQFFNTALNQRTTAQKCVIFTLILFLLHNNVSSSKSKIIYFFILFNIRSTRLATFPDYLMIHLKKFTLRRDWVPIKLDVSIDMPEELDISHLRGNGPQEGEILMPDVSETSGVFTYIYYNLFTNFLNIFI